MGMYDDIKHEMDCPKCGARVSGFQSKDGGCMLATLEFWAVNNFYASCPSCDTWIEFNRRGPIPITSALIEDYDMTIGRFTAKS